ncbi:nck-associated protein 5-like isoform X2 [Xyrauchen texanus]|uniref:nck-associated protein 5-like isoform X2 n=1 Tax=Xyrauchen texanus TaxID=154827 RepID=UPI002241A333|nr:nck-associated protein 5-like isoform X2 [Xyrauchen texanus]
MSEEAQNRVDEDFESEEGDLESYLEEESSSELLERVKELQAENSALSLANESQREAYERCLDEVANHVVQALLNQKDLREECIKLKMRVFDLERQNRTLCELLQEKLHSQSCAHQQPGPCLEHIGELQHSESTKLIETQRIPQAKGNSECAQNCIPDTQGSSTSMEAMSPFLKKKAHILEVLRKLEETDPLRYHRSSGIPSICDYSQALASKEAVLACRDNSSRCNAPKAHCSHSCPDVCTHQHLNGGEHSNVKCGSCSTCLMLSNKDSVSLAKSSHNCCTSNSINIDNLNLTRPDIQENMDSQSLVKPAIGTSELFVNRTSADVSILLVDPPNDPHPLEVPESYSRLSVSERDQTRGVPDHMSVETRDKNWLSDVLLESQSNRSSDSSCNETICDDGTIDVTLLDSDLKHLNVVVPQRLEKEIGSEEFAVKEYSDCVYQASTATSKLPTLGLEDNAHFDMESNELVHKGLLFLPNENHTASKVLDDISVPVKDSTPTDPQSNRSKVAVSPNQVSCLREVKASPSKLLKFLKIPTIEEHTTVPNPPRLSPQLTRSSKIPCRSNNYEVQQSPVATRKATTTERQRQLPASKSESHSAPTSPPQPDDVPTQLTKELSCGIPKTSRVAKPTQSSPIQKTPQKIPHYENVSDLSKTCGTDVSQLLVEVSSSLCSASPSKEGVKGKQQKCVIEWPTSLKQKDISPESDSSDQEDSSESPVWHKQVNHRSLPSQSSSQKVQSGIGTRSRSQEKNEVTVNDPRSTQSPFKRDDPPPVPRKSGIGRHLGESSHSFKERLAALGKLRNPEETTACPPLAEKKEIQSPACILAQSNDKSKMADRNSDCRSGEYRLPKNTETTDDKPYHSGHLDGAISKQADQAVRSLPSSSLVSKIEHESSRTFLAKQESPKSKMHPPSTNLEAAQALRSYAKSTTPHSLSYNVKNVSGSHSSSPNKIPLKSPTKTVPPSMNRDGKPTPEFQRYMSKSEDRSHHRANKKKTSYGESLPPPPPRPVESVEEKRHSAPSPQSSIEQKVMKGIEENMLKLQEQDKGQIVEVKQKASNGIANWFGLRKSKLPALSRKPEASKMKDDKREWKLNISSVGKDTKGAAKKTESESLNISMLIEKAEGLHKALEEERAYVNGVALDRQGKGHSCEVVMDQAQGQLSVMYRGVPSDNFMQQLLNRVDGKDAGISMAHRRLSFDCKSRPVFSHQSTVIPSQTRSNDDMEKVSTLNKDVTSDENLAETIHHEHFAVPSLTCSGISTHTLDSGIGTFPLPDYSANVGCKSIPKGKAHGECDPPLLHGKHGSGMKSSHKGWTLERELSSLEEDYMGSQDMDHRTSTLETKIPSSQIGNIVHDDTDICGAPMKLGPPTKNWTFPNLKASAEPSEVYLGVGDGVEPISHKSSFKRHNKTSDSMANREGDPRSLPQPGQARRGKSRIPTNPEMVRDTGLELVRERPDDGLSPSHPQVLETPESLSDSLYDSLSSCGSQG